MTGGPRLLPRDPRSRSSHLQTGLQPAWQKMIELIASVWNECWRTQTRCQGGREWGVWLSQLCPSYQQLFLTLYGGMLWDVLCALYCKPGLLFPWTHRDLEVQENAFFSTASIHPHAVSYFAAVPSPKLQQTMTGFSTLLKGNVTEAQRKTHHFLMFFPCLFFFSQSPLCHPDSRLLKPRPCYYTAIAACWGFTLTAPITSGGRARPGDFNTVNLHTPGDLQQYDFLYLRRKKHCPDNLILSVFWGAVFFFSLLFNVKPFRAFWKNNSIDPASALLKAPLFVKELSSLDLGFEPVRYRPSLWLKKAGRLSEKMAPAPPPAVSIIGRISLQLESLFSCGECDDPGPPDSTSPGFTWSDHRCGFQFVQNHLHFCGNSCRKNINSISVSNISQEWNLNASTCAR